MGYRIKELREQVGMSQEELARSSGVSRATLSGLESGRVEITTTKTLKAIATALNVTVGDIILP